MGTRSKTRHPGILKDHRSQKYVVRVRDRHGRQRARSFERLSEALEWQAEHRTGKGAEPGNRVTAATTFADYARTIPSMHPEWSPGTVNAWNSRLARLERVGFGELRLAEITAGDVQRALAKLRASGLADSTIAADRGLVTATYRHAIADELVDSNPTDRLPVSKSTGRAAVDVDSALTREQLSTLIGALPASLRALAVTMATTGLRPAEAAGITGDRLDLLHGVATIDRQLVGVYPNREPKFGPPKTPSSSRVVDLPDATIAALERHLEEFGLAEFGLVFAGPRLGRPLTRGRLSEAWRTYTDGLGFPDSVRGWHSLRHTYATTALAAGVPANIVAANLGHRNAAVTLSVYSHDAREARREARNAVADAFGSFADVG